MDVPTLNPNLRASDALSLLFNRSAPKPHLFGFLATPPSPLCLRNGALFAGNNVAPAAEIIYIFSFLPSLLCHVQLVVAAEPVSEEERAKGGGGGWEREGEPAMGTRHADRYSGWARDAPPSALPLGGQAAPPPPHPVKRGGGEERKARAVIPLPLLRLAESSVRSAGQAGWLQTSARGNFQGKNAKLFSMLIRNLRAEPTLK